jgi:hypothetical protein
VISRSIQIDESSHDRLDNSTKEFSAPRRQLRSIHPQSQHLGQTGVPPAEGLDGPTLKSRLREETLDRVWRETVLVIGDVVQGPQEWRGKEKEATRLEDAPGLLEEGECIWDMFEDLGTEHHVYRAVLYRDDPSIPIPVWLHPVLVSKITFDIDTKVLFDRRAIDDIASIWHLAAADVQHRSSAFRQDPIDSLQDGASNHVVVEPLLRSAQYSENRRPAHRTSFVRVLQETQVSYLASQTMGQWLSPHRRSDGLEQRARVVALVAADAARGVGTRMICMTSSTGTV